MWHIGENLLLNIQSKDLRISRDWVGNQWVDIEAKPDILSAISAAISLDVKIPTSLIGSKDAAVSCPKVSTGTMQDGVEEKLDLVAPVSSIAVPEDMDCDNQMEQPSCKDGSVGNDADHANDSHNDENLDSSTHISDNEKNNIDEDDHNDGGENGRELDLEDFENARQKCPGVELMEVVA